MDADRFRAFIARLLLGLVVAGAVYVLFHPTGSGFTSCRYGYVGRLVHVGCYGE